MSNPVKELKQLLGGTRQAVSGSVVSVDGGAVLVATRRGTITAQASGKAYSVGDRVSLNGVAITGKLVPDDQLPTYVI